MRALAEALAWEVPGTPSNEFEEEMEKVSKQGVQGMIVPYGQLKELKLSAHTDTRVNLPESLRDDGVQVAIMTRNVFFWALSKAKKRHLKNDVRESRARKYKRSQPFHATYADEKADEGVGIDRCENWNQRGSSKCQAADSAYRFSISPKELADIVEEIEEEERDLHRLAVWVSALFRGEKLQKSSAYKVIRYEDVLCASDTLGNGALPLQLLSMLGMRNCSSLEAKLAHFIGRQATVRVSKSSPANPCSALTNIGELRSWSSQKKQSWAKYFDLRTQSQLVGCPLSDEKLRALEKEQLNFRTWEGRVKGTFHSEKLIRTSFKHVTNASFAERARGDGTSYSQQDPQRNSSLETSFNITLMQPLTGVPTSTLPDDGRYAASVGSNAKRAPGREREKNRLSRKPRFWAIAIATKHLALLLVFGACACCCCLFAFDSIPDYSCNKNGERFARFLGAWGLGLGFCGGFIIMK